MAKDFRADRAFSSIRAALSKIAGVLDDMEKSGRIRGNGQRRRYKCEAEGCNQRGSAYYRGFCPKCGKALRKMGAL